MRQNQLTSNGVLEQTDYSNFAPIAKKQVDMNNFGKEMKITESPNKKAHRDLHGVNHDWQYNNKEQIKKDYSNYTAKNQKHDFLRSNLDDHGYDLNRNMQNYDEYNEKLTKTIPSKNANQDKKLKHLGSNLEGYDPFSYYNHQTKGEIVDFDLGNLPSNIDRQRIKDVASVKHIVASDFDIDNLRGVATGDGRVKIRLNEGETIDQIRLNFLKAGYSVKNHELDARKKQVITGPEKELQGYHNMSAKDRKFHELQSKNPTAFGNHESYHEMDARRKNKLAGAAK